MKHLVSNTRLLLLGLLMFFVSGAWASNQWHDLQIFVTLHDNGDADILEKREMSIDGEGTECYIVIGNLNGSQIKNFSVTDETGREYINEGSWNVNRSRQQKANRCGIVSKGSGGYELCWGLGNTGERTYIVSYTVTGLVRSYTESDGFNFMFLAQDVKPSPESADIEIKMAGHPEGFSPDSTKIWAFGFPGSIDFEEGLVVASANEALTPSNYMVVMMELEKGVLHPQMEGNGSFKDVRKKAFEEGPGGKSSYKEETYWDKVKRSFADVTTIFLFLVIAGVMGLLGWIRISRRRERKKLEKSVDWYRQVPTDPNLVRANSIMEAYKFGGKENLDNLMSAMILRMIRTSTLRIENHYLEPTGFKKLIGGEGKYQDCIVLGDFDENNRLLSTSAMRKLYNIFLQAAGDDRILQPKELTRWMHRNEDEVMNFVNALKPNVSIKECRNNIEEVKQIFGLKKFLKDFTLANERHISEVNLWNDYLVYATLFGIGDQLLRDMQKINPEYLKMNEVIRNMTDKTVLPTFTAAALQSTHSVKHSVESRNSGGGGSSSIGGGGGFSGGGSGGGVR